MKYLLTFALGVFVCYHFTHARTPSLDIQLPSVDPSDDATPTEVSPAFPLHPSDMGHHSTINL